MTKKVRIENADTSNHRVRVFVERLNEAGEWVRTDPPVELDFPAALHEGWIHQGQRLVVEEAKP